MYTKIHVHGGHKQYIFERPYFAAMTDIVVLFTEVFENHSRKKKQQFLAEYEIFFAN